MAREFVGSNTKIIPRANLLKKNNIYPFFRAIEASEGTNELISRCNNYKKKGDQGILIKLSKYNQSHVLDIPTIGLETLKLLKKFNYEGIFIELNKCLVINKDEVSTYANDNNLFIAAINKIE